MEVSVELASNDPQERKKEIKFNRLEHQYLFLLENQVFEFVIASSEIKAGR